MVREIGFNGFFQATVADSGFVFDIKASNDTIYTDSWELQLNGESNNINKNGGGGFDRIFGEWDADDQGKPLNLLWKPMHLTRL